MNKIKTTQNVEKSSYLHKGNYELYNLDSFKYDSKSITMIDLFSGAGGFSVGAEWAGVQPVLGIDYFKPAMETWYKNHLNSIGCLGDIKEIKPEEMNQLLQLKGVNKVNIITGGVPCQGFSLANRKRTENDERNFLFLEFMKYVKVFDPDYIILENVAGLRSTAGGKFEDNIIDYMNTLGYEAEVKIVNAADYGVPQVRKRIIFVGVKKGRNLSIPYEFPTGKFVNNHRTVDDAISDLPVIESGESFDEYTMEYKTDYQKLMRGYGKIKEIDAVDKVYDHVAPKHPQKTIDKIKDIKPGEPIYSKFKQRIRLNGKKSSPTQLAGGIRPQFQFGHPIQNRGLSIRERARIQSFPDSFKFYGGTVQARVQTGNAVPPLLIYNLIKPIVKDLQQGG